MSDENKVMINRNSKIQTIPKVSEDRRGVLGSCLDLHSTSILRKYLSFPLKLPGSNNHDFDYVIERLQSKCARWKVHLLSLARRVNLTQSVLSTIPAYVMQGTTLDTIDKISKSFIWGTIVEKRKLHTVN